MLLRNFDCAIEANIVGTSKIGKLISMNHLDANIQSQATNGTIAATVIGTDATYSTSIAVLSFSESSICIGDGTSLVKYEDFRLAGNRIGGKFTLVSNEYDYNKTDKCWERTLTVKYTNETNDDFVVSEWGIYRGIGSSAANTGYVYTNSSQYEVLVWRELLDEPVTIAANSTATLTFTLKVPHEVNAF